MENSIIVSPEKIPFSIIKLLFWPFVITLLLHYSADSKVITVKEDSSGTKPAIAAALSAAVPGDSIIVYPGTYGFINIKQLKGRTDAWITLTGTSLPDQTGSRPYVKCMSDTCSKIAPDPLSNAVISGIMLSECSYLRISRFEITDNSMNAAILLSNGGNGNNNIEISQNYIHTISAQNWNRGINSGGNGVLLNNTDIIIRNNTFFRVNGIGIYIFGHRWIVEANEISHAVAYSSQQGKVIGGECDAIRIYGTNHRIRYNFIHDYTDDEASGHSDAFQIHSNNPQTQFAHRILIERNFCMNNSQMLMGQDQGEQSTGINYVDSITIRENVFFKTGAAALMFDNVDNLVFANNIVAQAWYSGIAFVNNCSKDSIYNNIFYRNGQSQWSTSKGSNAGSQIRTTAGYCSNVNYTFFDYNVHYPTFTFPPRFLDTHAVFIDYCSASNTECDPGIFKNALSPLGDDGTPFTSDDGFFLASTSQAAKAGLKGLDAGPYKAFASWSDNPWMRNKLNPVMIDKQNQQPYQNTRTVFIKAITFGRPRKNLMFRIAHFVPVSDMQICNSAGIKINRPVLSTHYKTQKCFHSDYLLTTPLPPGIFFIRYKEEVRSGKFTSGVLPIINLK